MGKSPGKWIKTLLFGKKASRSNASKGKETSKATNEKERWITGRGSATDSPLISHPFPDPTDRNGQNSDLDNRVASGLPCDEEVALPVSQGEGKPERSDGSGVFTDPEKSRQEKAAIKAQAAFRGYLARRAFRALRGIIRLQALVRGHLVRRQAVAMLRCLQAIIRLQALVRGRRVRLSEIGMTVNKNFSEGKDGHPSNNLVVNTPIPVEKLLANAFACKLLASSPKAMPLLIQYPLEEPNSAWNWLVAWTSTRFWHPPSQPKKGLDSKHQTKLGASHASEIEPRRLKRIVRRNPLSSESGLTHFPSDPEKPKRNLRKILSHPVDPVQENPQNELDKVKRSLKKVSNSTAEGSSDRSEIDMEKPKRSVRKVISSTSVVPELGDGDATEKMKKNATETSPSQSNIKTGLKPLTIDGSVESLNNDHVEVDITPSESNGKDGNISIANGELSSKEDQTCPDNPKNCRRRASFPAKSDYVENGIQSNPTLPSYMATTESAKAKLRAQGSPRFGQDGVEKNGFTRRHSLPSSANGKVSSLSPRTQRLVQAGGKAGIRYDRSLLSSRDGNEKAIQIEWRR